MSWYNSNLRVFSLFYMASGRCRSERNDEKDFLEEAQRVSRPTSAPPALQQGSVWLGTGWKRITKLLWVLGGIWPFPPTAGSSYLLPQPIVLSVPRTWCPKCCMWTPTSDLQLSRSYSTRGSPRKISFPKASCPTRTHS